MRFLKTYKYFENVDGSIDYEELSRKKPNYSIGDYVYYIDYNREYLTYGEKYLVSDIRESEGYYYTYVDNLPDTDNGWYASRFATELEW